MKKLQLGFAALLLSFTVAIAQPVLKQQDKRSGHLHKEMALDQLNLTDAQKAQVKALNEDFSKRMQAIKSNENQTVKQQHEQRAELAKEHKAKLENILTPAQKSQLAERKKNVRQKGGEMTANRIEKIKTELNLSNQQVAQIQKEQQAFKSKLDAVQNNTSLDRTAKMAQMKALKEEMKSNMERVLTPEQKEKWKTMHQGKKKDGRKHFRRHHKSDPIV